MSHTTVRITQTTREMLRSLAEAHGEPMQVVLAKAVEAYRRQRFLEQINKAYADLRRDETAWMEVEKERVVWEQTLSDGLPAEGPTGGSARAASPKRRRRKR